MPPEESTPAKRASISSCERAPSLIGFLSFRRKLLEFILSELRHLFDDLYRHLLADNAGAAQELLFVSDIERHRVSDTHVVDLTTSPVRRKARP
jgi:hypothetical protein